MNPHVMTAAGITLIVGPAAADRTPQALHGRTRPAGPITCVYINAATGERIFTAKPGRPVSPGRSSSDEVWIADNDTPCAAYGSDHAWIGVVDIPGYGTPAATRATFLDWGDVGQDTVVDCVQVTWSSAHADVDADDDGYADGVEGFGSTWVWFDVDNGFNNNWRTGIVGVTLVNLPGNHTPDVSEFATYVATVDLEGFSPVIDLSFEICDTDGNRQGAAVHNPFIGLGDIDFDGNPDSDMDGDGLADFSYAQSFFQPGTVDINDDGVIDGDPTAAARTAVLLVAPSEPLDPLPAGQGMEDAFDVLTDINHDGFYEPFGTFWYGGFTCDRDGNGVPGDAADDYRAFAQFHHVLYSSGPSWVCCPPDIGPDGTCFSGDGVLNFFDVANFIALFNAGNLYADFFPPAGGDGVLNFYDISTYINYFNSGCP